MTTPDPAVLQAALSVLRSVLIALGAFFVSKGFLTSEGLDQLVGAILLIVPVGWGIWQKFQAERSAKKREVIAVNVGFVVADATVGPTPPIAPVRVPAVIAAVKPRILLAAEPEKAPFIIPDAPASPRPIL